MHHSPTKRDYLFGNNFQTPFELQIASCAPCVLVFERNVMFVDGHVLLYSTLLSLTLQPSLKVHLRALTASMMFLNSLILIA